MPLACYIYIVCMYAYDEYDILYIYMLAPNIYIYIYIHTNIYKIGMAKTDN